MEFLYDWRRKGLTVKEVPYVFRDRQKGPSKSAPSLWRFLRTGMQYVTRIFVARLRRPELLEDADEVDGQAGRFRDSCVRLVGAVYAGDRLK